MNFIKSYYTITIIILVVNIISCTNQKDIEPAAPPTQENYLEKTSSTNYANLSYTKIDLPKYLKSSTNQIAGTFYKQEVITYYYSLNIAYCNTLSEEGDTRQDCKTTAAVTALAVAAYDAAFSWATGCWYDEIPH